MSAAQRAETIREEAVNTLLALSLRGRGVAARAERRSREGAPDLRVELRTGDSLLLECKWGGDERALAAQLDERLEAFPDALAVAGVLYPDRIRRADDAGAALEAAADLRWRLHGSRGAATPERAERTGSAAELAEWLRALPLELEGVDRVAAAAAAIGYALERAAAAVSAHARVARRVADLIASTDRERDRAAALRIGCLVLFNALAFQDRLAAVHPDAPSVAEARRGGPAGPGLAGLRDAWRAICERIDYVPVFELAADILDAVADAPDDTQRAVLDPLAKAMEQTRRLEGHDLSGRLFHTLLTDAKFTGAYYTSVPAATLLARLAFEGWPPGVDWADHEFPASLSVADLACGTGTLLMAVADEARRRHEDAGGDRSADLHKAMVEQALHGYDVQLSAVHFAATSLAMLNPNVQFDRMNMWVMELGVEGDRVSLGSLDFLGVDEAPVQFALSPDAEGAAAGRGAERVSGGGPRGAAEGQTARLPDLDLAIMNPPFTRSGFANKLFGSLPSVERRTMQDELARRLKERRATATAGLGAAFVAAAAPKLARGGGRLALVLPATVCTGPSWASTRSLIAGEFGLDMVIASHDPARWNFSDSTALSEVLLIATRRPEADGSESEGRTTYVNLWRNPDGVLDAHLVARAVAATPPARIEDAGAALLEVDGQHVGEAFTMPEPTGNGAQWSGIQFARADVVRAALRLLGGQVRLPGDPRGVDIPLCPLRDLGEIGPDPRDVMDGFETTDAVTAYPMVEGHDTDQRRRMTTEPDKHLAPLVEAREGRRLKPVDQLWSKAGSLLVTRRLRLNTARVAAMISEVPVLSNMWWPVQCENAAIEKALAVWLNSSLGLLAMLGIRMTTAGAWVQLKKAELQALPVLDVRALGEEQREGLAALFDAMAGEEFERLPAMAQCPARAALDAGVARILGLPDGLDALRRLLASEPVVSNRRL